MKQLLLLVFVFLSIFSTAHPSEDSIYTYVEKMPSAGYDFHSYFFRNFRYPKNSRELELRIIVKFIVEKSGGISHCRVVNSISEELEKEVLRVVCCMPPWKSGKKNGKPVAVWYTLPVRLGLE